MDLITAVNVDQEGWIVITDNSTKQIISEEEASIISTILKSDAFSGWEISATEYGDEDFYSWHVAGTDPYQGERSLIMVLLIENLAAEETRDLGRKIISSAISN